MSLQILLGLSFPITVNLVGMVVGRGTVMASRKIFGASKNDSDSKVKYCAKIIFNTLSGLTLVGSVLMLPGIVMSARASTSIGYFLTMIFLSSVLASCAEICTKRK